MARKKNYGRGRGRKEKKVFPQVTGKVQMTREGFAFVIAEGEEDVNAGRVAPMEETFANIRAILKETHNG